MFVGIALACIFAASARGDDVASDPASVAPEIDGVVIRGAWRASVRVGSPRAALSGDALHPGAVVVTRRGTTLTFARTDMRPDAPRFELDVAVARLRGVATSGAVDLSVRDRSANPLFMDIAGASVARASGAVPLVRVTTSGSSNVDLSDLDARVARAHARQSSRLTIRARDAMTIAALDRARVTFVGPAEVDISSKDAATIERR